MYLQSIRGTLVQWFNVVSLLLLRLLLGLRLRWLSARGESLCLRGRDGDRAGQDGRARRRRRRRRWPVCRRRRHCRCRRDTRRGNIDGALILRCHRCALLYRVIIYLPSTTTRWLSLTLPPDSGAARKGRIS